MNQPMTVAEMESRVASEWILIGEPQTDENLCVRGGVVLWHSKDRGEVYRQASELRPGRFALHYTGTIPENTEIVL
jgi:hypothetical protein